MGFFFFKEDQQGKIGDARGISIDPKFCGPKKFVIEAFLDVPKNSYPTQLTFYGKAPEKIVSATWSRTQGGSSIGSNPIKFGDDMWLNLQTEGLNGAKVNVEIYVKQTIGSDDKVHTFNNVECFYGEVNLQINNTYNWRSKVGFFKVGEEEFYIKVKKTGRSEEIQSATLDTLIAKHEISTREITRSTSAKPLLIGRSEINVERYEACRFSKITITDDNKPIVIFDEQKLNIDFKKKEKFQLSETIHFDLDKDDIRPDAKPVLDGIANLLLDNPYVPATLGAHCDIRADHEYNEDLSNRRAGKAVAYLVQKGIARHRITAKGYGKRFLKIPGENISEAEHQLNRRLTVEFVIFQADTQAMIFETIAPDKTKKKKLEISIKNYDTTECLYPNSSLTHDHKNVRVLETTSDGQTWKNNLDGTKPFDYEVYSNLSRLTLVPLNYIWPHKNKTNDFSFYIHSCRYYSNKENVTILVKAYSDIKWDFHFFLNLSNSPSVRWQKLGPAKHKEMQQKAGKIGSERRNKNTEIDFGVILSSEWNKISDEYYKDKEELTLKFESKIKQLYSIFEKLKDASKIITGKTKSKAVKTLSKKFPLGVEVLPPNFCLGATWQLARGYKSGRPIQEVGTLIDFYFKAEPLLGLELTLDLLQLAITGATGPAAPILDAINDWIKGGKDSPLSVDLYVNLIVFGTINLPKASFVYNTASDDTDPNRVAKLDASATIGLRVEAGLVIKAKAVVVVAEFYAQAYAKFEGKGSITFGQNIEYKSDKLTYRPQLQFDGLTATVEIKAEIGLMIKKGWFEGDYKKDLTDLKRVYRLFRPFDIIKSVEKLTGKSATIALIG